MSNKKQLTREQWESWTDQQKLNWIALETNGKGIIPEMPYWLIYAHTDFVIRFTWAIHADGEHAYLKDVCTMSFKVGVESFKRYMNALAAVSNTN